MKRIKTKVIVPGFMFIMIIFTANHTRASDSTGYIKNLNAPALGITSATVILLWDDIFEPDLSGEDYTVNSGSYDVYRDDVKLASVNKHTYTATGLLPEHNYTFSVCYTKDREHRFLKESSITVSTRKAGKVISVKQFGATGNGSLQDVETIRQAINKCEKGGTVVIPPGTYLTNPFELKSDMTLEIQKGAMIVFVGFEELRKRPAVKSLIIGRNVHNVVITGEGIIDANGESWWPHFPPGTDRVDGLYRPFTLEFDSSSEILIQGITLQDPPMFNNVLNETDNVIYSRVKLLKQSTVPGRNGDALDPYASRNILIIDCVFGNQDDSIALKGSEKNGRFNENITIMDCLFDGNAAPGAHPLGFAIGSGCKARHILVKNCVFIDAASLANIKTNTEKTYTFVEDVRIENVTYINTKHPDKMWNRAPISIDQFYYAPEGSAPAIRDTVKPETPVFRNIQFRNIKINNPAGRGIYLAGFASLPIKQVSFTNVIVRSRDGVSIENVDDISMQSVKVMPF